MKKIILIGTVVVLASSIGAQSPAPMTSDHRQLDALLEQVQAQQQQIAENQANIDAKLASLAEAIRVARIYASRGGH
jgi:cell division protein FtsL